MKAPAVVKPYLTLLDGTAYEKEFPAWVLSSDKISESNKENSSKTLSSSGQNTYYESLKPIFILLTFAGILPVFKLRIGTRKCGLALVAGVCLAVYIIFSYLTYLVSRDIIFMIFHDVDFSSIILQVMILLLLFQHVFYLILTWPESIAVNKYLIEWKKFQNQYEIVTGSKLSVNCKLRVKLAVGVAAVLSTGYPYCIDMIDGKSIISNKISYMVLSYHTFIQLCFYILWFSNSWAVTQATEQFNTLLSQECQLDISAERLEEYRLVWMRLTEIVRAGSSMLSYTMALMLTTPFAYQVIGAYNATMFIIRAIQQNDLRNTNEAIATGLTFLFYATLLYMFCNSGHWMTLTCEKIQYVLLINKPKLSSSLTEINSELRLFLRCLRSVPPRASLSGYVIINRKVFLHMTGVLVTYLIILVQFNIGSVNKRPNHSS